MNECFMRVFYYVLLEGSCAWCECCRKETEENVYVFFWWGCDVDDKWSFDIDDWWGCDVYGVNIGNMAMEV